MEFSLKKLKSIFIESDPEEVEEVAPVAELPAEEDILEDIAWEEPKTEAPVVEEAKPVKEPIYLQISQFRACSEVGAKVLDDYPVFVDFSTMDYADAKRALDFLGGVIFAVKGTLQPVADTVFYLAKGEKQDEETLQKLYRGLCE